MKNWKKIITMTLSTAVLIPSTFSGALKAKAAMTEKLSIFGGWNETLYTEWDEKDAEDATVSYKLSTDSTYTELSEADEELIRQEDKDTARVDIPGVKSGTYDLKVTTSEGKVYTADNIKVKENDRSGYAHFNYDRGVGTDAFIHGWGFSFYVGDGYTNRESYEVKNLTFKDYPEDALGFQGFMSDSKTLATPIEHVWVHNNSFYPGFCAKPAESDKAEGDGSCDFKRGKYYTMDYNYYNGCHKTNLVGASDTNLQFNMTFHHNFYENCGSISPLARQANIHIYNSYFKGNTSKTVDARANAYILSEGNYYESCANPMLSKSGAVVK